MSKEVLLETVKKIATPGLGILAADESFPTIKKRFAAIKLESTPENHRRYRNLLFTTPNLNQYLCGVILFDETFFQKSNTGVLFPEVLSQQGILPGIKVDQGLITLAQTDAEKTTQGLDGLEERLDKYRAGGAKFAKWRCVYNIASRQPSRAAIHANAELLARYAAICQAQGIVPIVEPEVLITGEHTIEKCAAVMESVLTRVFTALRMQRVLLEGMVLKPSMVTSGDVAMLQADTKEIAHLTVQTLKRVVPAAVPSINFLSGGQSPEAATRNLNAMHQLGRLPWNLSFSYGRALQDPALQLWQGKDENLAKAQQALEKRLQLNSAATLGKYNEKMEKAN